jgi:hypothetical protein
MAGEALIEQVLGAAAGSARMAAAATEDVVARAATSPGGCGSTGCCA